MKKNKLFSMVSVILLASMILAACAPAATPAAPAEEPTAAPTEAAPTEAPTEAAPAEEPTAEAPAEEPVADTTGFEALKVEAPNCDYGGNFKSMEAVDPYTVKFTLCAPDVAFLSKISLVSFGVLDKEYLAETGGDVAKINENPVGTGPYKFKEWVRGDHISFVANPDYWGNPTTNNEFILRWSTESAQRLLELQSGNTNGIDNPGPDDWAVIEGDANLKIYPRPVPNLLYLGINNNVAPFDKPEVRKAFAMALDRQRIVDDFYTEGSTVAEQVVPPTVKPGYTDGFKMYEYDPEAAKAMLEEAGFDFDAEYTLSYAERTRAYFPQPTKIAQDIQAQYAEIGVKIKLDLMEWGAYLEAVRGGQKGLHILGWGEDYPDATNWYDVFFTGSSPQFGTPDQKVIDLIKEARTSADTSFRQEKYDEINKLLQEDVVYIPIAHGTTGTAFAADVENVVVGPYNENFSQMKTASGTLIFTQNSDPVSMWPADETDGETFRAALQIYQTLYAYPYGAAEPQPQLAENCTASDDILEWTCTLRKDVKFHNGATLMADDVIATYSAIWDVENPYHKGNTSVFQYWKDFFGPLLNAPVE